MVDDPTTSEPFSLKRWSQRKRAAARTEPVEPLLPPASDLPSAAVAAISSATAAPVTIPEATPLPPVDSLTFDSDFSAFMQPKIDEETKRAALKKLFSDPSFNVMDGLDIYVGDYTQSDPMPAGMLDKLSAVYAMLDPVKPPPDEPTVAVKTPAPTDTDPLGLAELPVDSAEQAPLALPTSASGNTEIEPEPDTGTA
jgi:hypothetical protein